MELTAKLYRALQKACKMVDLESKRLRFKHWLYSQITTVHKIWVSPYCCFIGNSAGKTCLQVTSVLQKLQNLQHRGFWILENRFQKWTGHKTLSNLTLTVRAGCLGIFPDFQNPFAFTLLPTCTYMYLWVRVSFHSQDAVVAISNAHHSLRLSEE